MKTYKAQIFIIIFVLCLTNLSAAQEVEEVLDKVEENIESTNYLSFHSEYIDINPGVEDSIFKSSATVWLERVPTDSIFGAYFHLDGNDRGKHVEYFYDGQSSYEIRHASKKVTIFHPHEYPNNPNNPAKSRTALLAFKQLLINPNFKNSILEGHLNTSLKQNENGTKWIITVSYQTNDFGQEITKSLFIDKDTYLIDRINQTLIWNGKTSKTRYRFSNYKQNDSSISEKVFMSKNYNEYTQEVHQRGSDESTNAHAQLIGNSAPEFTFSSFSRKEISLKRFKGKLVLLDFWETWCGYCIMAMPKLNGLQEEYKNDVNIIGVTTQNKEQVEKLIQKNDLGYANIYADRSILDDYKISNRPTYILIDQKGKIATVTYGDLEKIEAKIKTLLN